MTDSHPWVQPFSKEQPFPLLSSQKPGSWHSAHGLFVRNWDPFFSECMLKSRERAWPGLAMSCNVLGLRMFLTALVTCCCCGDSSQDPLDDIFFFLFSFFPPCSPGRYKSSTQSSLSKLFHKKGFCPLLWTDLDMHHPEMKTSWWRQWKERGANTLLSPWGLLVLRNCHEHLRGLRPSLNFMQGR